MKLFKTVIAALLLLCSTVATAHDFTVGGIYYNVTRANSVEVTYNGEYHYNSANSYSGSVTIPSSVTYNGTTYTVITIGENAFYGCLSLTSIEIPNSVTTIENQAFFVCTSLANVTLPNSLTTIKNQAFYNCTSLASITIPNSVTTIGSNAFYACTSLASITIPSSVTPIGNSAFSGCSSLTSISVAAGNTIYDSRNNCNAIIETATNTLVAGCKNTVIPNSVTTIGSYAFEGCRSLASIEIPNSVTDIRYGALSFCSSLTSISVAAGNTTYDSRDNCNAIIETATNTLVAGCKNTVIPNSVTAIGDKAFYYCSSLASITIPSSVTAIGYKAFYYCSSLANITSLIPADKLFIPDDDAFYNINPNCTLYVPAGAKETYATTVSWLKFTNIVELSVFDLTVSAAKYATLFLDFDAIIPQDVEVYTASTVDGNRLMMEQVTDILPANTGVIVRAEQGTYSFYQSYDAPQAIEGNLFRGSIEDIYITPAKEAKYYVLSMKDGVVGMYEDALSGGTFKNNANKAYLVLGEKNLGIYDEEVDTEDPGMQLSNKYYFDFGGTTAIDPVVTEVNDNIYYDLSGRRVENPTRGIYILNGKKILVK